MFVPHNCIYFQCVKKFTKLRKNSFWPKIMSKKTLNRFQLIYFEKMGLNSILIKYFQDLTLGLPSMWPWRPPHYKKIKIALESWSWAQMIALAKKNNFKRDTIGLKSIVWPWWPLRSPQYRITKVKPEACSRFLIKVLIKRITSVFWSEYMLLFLSSTTLKDTKYFLK